MDIISFVAQFGGWSWLVAGLVLLALELVLPGGILIWLGASAIVTGILALLAPGIDWPWLFLVYGALALASIFVWLRLRPHGTASDRPFLNRRADSWVGHEMVLDEPIRGGFGRVALGDSTWRIQGPDLAAGQRVRVVGAEGAVLKVEAIA